MRVIHRPEGEWKYKIGKRFIELLPPKGPKKVVAIEDLLGPDEAKRREAARRTELEERWEENNFRGFAVRPADIRSYIERTAP